MPIVTWLNDPPPEVVPALERLVTDWLWLTPPWCQELNLRWEGEGDEDGRAMSAEAHYEYRRIKICFYGGWLNRGENRQSTLVHELLHGFIAVLNDYAFNALIALMPDDCPQRRMILQELSVRNESVVQDLAFRIYERFADQTTTSDC